MKNYWLKEYTEAMVKQANHPWDVLTNGKWTVARYIKGDWMRLASEFPSDSASINWPDTYYLHKDGNWVKNSCYKDDEYVESNYLNYEFKDDCWTGYFDTKEEALAVLNPCSENK